MHETPNKLEPTCSTSVKQAQPQDFQAKSKVAQGTKSLAAIAVEKAQQAALARFYAQIEQEAADSRKIALQRRSQNVEFDRQ